MIVREIHVCDAEKFAHLTQQVEANSEYMLWEAGERKIPPKQQEKILENIVASENSTIFVAENNHNKLVGYLLVIGGNAKRNKHVAYIVVGILRDYRGQGLGKRLFEELVQWSKEHGIHRLELTVVTLNEAALSLYKKMGFEIEGSKRHSLYIDGEFVDEYYMSKLL